jgi:predicted branched-subunit amino acid permease
MLSARHDFWKGFWGALPFCFVVGPYGMVFGVLAAESGLNIFTSIAFSLAVIAGAAQFTALSLMHDQAPTIVVIIVGLTVNLRMALYSATLATHLGKAPFWTRALVAYSIFDHSFALSDAKYQNNPGDDPVTETGLLLWSNRTGGGHMGHWNWYWRMVGRARA